MSAERVRGQGFDTVSSAVAVPASAPLPPLGRSLQCCRVPASDACLSCLAASCCCNAAAPSPAALAWPPAARAWPPSLPAALAWPQPWLPAAPWCLARSVGPTWLEPRDVRVQEHVQLLRRDPLRRRRHLLSKRTHAVCRRPLATAPAQAAPPELPPPVKGTSGSEASLE